MRIRGEGNEQELMSLDRRQRWDGLIGDVRRGSGAGQDLGRGPTTMGSGAMVFGMDPRAGWPPREGPKEDFGTWPGWR